MDYNITKFESHERIIFIRGSKVTGKHFGISNGDKRGSANTQQCWGGEKGLDF